MACQPYTSLSAPCLRPTTTTQDCLAEAIPELTTSVAAPNLHHTEHPTEKEAGTDQGRRDKAKDVDEEQEEEKDEVDEEDEENEEVDVERNTSVDDIPLPAATKPANPRRAHESDAAPSTSSDDDETSSDDEEDNRTQHSERPAKPDNQAEDEGWVTKKKKRRQKAKVAPTPRIKSSAALRGSSGITKLRLENKSGRVVEEKLKGYYNHVNQQFIGMIKGCNGDCNGLYRYPTKVTPGNSVVDVV
ncbi:hypothetical protein E2C01_078555 [Portunus trituberculatus]|uniref:Uncharacterized protein n=1 Tax=Portunus trituberculatus TaxID=210409 RepID=A0A5B7IQH3_PORTR|nr:hypothetical protein [Portunus trituberculatus]